MKKYFLSVLAITLFAAIAVSSNSIKSPAMPMIQSNKVYDTLPQRMDSSHTWNDTSGNMMDTSNNNWNNRPVDTAGHQQMADTTINN